VPEPTLYFDRNVGWRVPEALKLLGFNVIHHNTKRRLLGLKETPQLKTLFAQNEKDDVWLQYVGQQGWLVLTQDRKFHRAGFEAELSAIKQFNVGCFYIWGAEHNKWQKMQALCRGLDGMITAAAMTSKPFIFDAERNGKLTRVPIP
jgi:PIN domain-containing protein